MGTTAREGSSGEGISHFNAIRLRVIGSGNLDLILYSLDDVKSQTLNPLVLQTTTNIQPTKKCNFMQQRMALEISTDVMDEYFRINRIIIFSKPTFANFPG